jgi:hypothetical protein
MSNLPTQAIDIDIQDDREYAWLLVRSGTVTDSLIKIWNFIPIRKRSIVAAAFGYPLRLALVITLFALSASLTLLTLVALAQLPVAAFALARPLLPDILWLVVIGSVGVSLTIYFAVATGIWLQAAARGQEAGSERISALSTGVLARPVSPTGGWNRWDSLHVSHESARSGLFAGLSVGLGFVMQCLTVIAGPAHFEGSVEAAWRWPVAFGEQLMATALLGIPAGIVPTFGGIEPVTALGRLLLVGVDIFFAAGVIGLGVIMFSSLFKVRELFNGSTRDLVDYLENFDLSSKGKLMIHRVAVVRPLDERQCVSMTREELFRQVRSGTDDPVG